jgi:coenzyme PQQ precursor peptide PqqA
MRVLKCAHHAKHAMVENARVDAPNLKRGNMTWNAPKIVEVAVGMEINMYACASRKT